MVFKIFLLNFVVGIAATIVMIISVVFIFGFPGFTLAPGGEPPLRPYPPSPQPIELQVIGILIAALYIFVLIYGNKSLISDSPYKFEYRVVAIVSYTIGFLIGFGSFS